MGIMQHLAELRKALLKSFLVVFVLTVISYNFIPSIFLLLTKPFESGFASGNLIGTGPAEVFLLKIKLAFSSGLLFAMPWIFLEFWLFVSPGLHASERKLLLPFVFSTSILFFIGVYFAYKLILPVALSFFEGQYSSLGISPEIRVSEYLSILLKLLFCCGLVFELPVISVFLAKVGLINSKIMLQSWRYVLVIAFILAAVFTPPDVMSQFLLVGPMVVLYLFSVVLVKFFAEKD